MKIRDKSPDRKEMIKSLYEKGFDDKRPLWRAIAVKLNRPRSKQHEVNLYEIEKHAKPGESVVVPGVVLGTGELTKKVTVAAYKFSKSAAEKIKKAGGTCMTLDEFARKYKKGDVKIMG